MIKLGHLYTLIAPNGHETPLSWQGDFFQSVIDELLYQHIKEKGPLKLGHGSIKFREE